MTNILVPLDGSSYAKVTTDFLVNHRWTGHTNVKLLHAIEPLADDVYTDEANETALHAKAQKLLNEVAKQLTAFLPSVTISQLITRGEPQEVILNEAAMWPADLIVLGSHSHHDPHKTSIGSVALTVLGKTRSTVIIVRVPPGRIRDLSLQSENENLRARYKYCDNHAS